MLKDLRLSLRTLLRQPSFTAVVVVSLALGIGGSTAIFSVFNAVLLRDLPYPDPGQLYMMRTVTADGSPTGTITPRETRPFSENPDHPMVDALAIAWSQEVQIVGSDGSTHPTRRYGVTDQSFDVFGPRMELGRGFERGDQPGLIVIAYSIWRDVFGADPDIVDKAIGAEGGTLQVAGVTSAVPFSCKGRAFCPSCGVRGRMGLRICCSTRSSWWHGSPPSRRGRVSIQSSTMASWGHARRGGRSSSSSGPPTVPALPRNPPRPMRRTWRRRIVAMDATTSGRT